MMKNIETNHTIDEYMTKYGNDYLLGNLWDFDKTDFDEGIEFKNNIVYWLINDRYYETPLSNNTTLKEEYDVAIYYKNNMKDIVTIDDKAAKTTQEAMNKAKLKFLQTEWDSHSNDLRHKGYDQKEFVSLKNKAYQTQIVNNYNGTPDLDDESLQENKKKKRKQKYPVHYIGMFGYGPLYNNMVPPSPTASSSTSTNIPSAPAPTISAGSTTPPTSPVGNAVSTAPAASASVGESLNETTAVKDWNQICSNFLDLTEFSLNKNDDGTWSLEDNQQVNLGGIESFKFKDACSMFDRMSVYIDDYILENLGDEVKKEDYPQNDDCEGWVTWYTDDMQNKYEELHSDIDYCDLIANHCKDIDLNKVYSLQGNL
jgi:hypothetical protein